MFMEQRRAHFRVKTNRQIIFTSHPFFTGNNIIIIFAKTFTPLPTRLIFGALIKIACNFASSVSNSVSNESVWLP